MINIKQLGFTLIEVVVTISIIVVVTAVTIPLYSHWQTLSVLDSSRFEVLQDIRFAQDKAMAGYNDSDFGVYFTSSGYTLFQGTTYLTRDSSQDIARKIPSTIVLSGLNEVTFAKKTGEPSVTGTLVLTNTADNSKESILINPEGMIN